MKYISPIEIRPARAEDAKAAAGIVFAILRSYGIEPDPQHLDREVVEFGSNDLSTVREFAAFLENHLVGVCTLKFQDLQRPLISALYVDPRARGRGIGKKLLLRAIEEARTLNFRFLELETRAVFKEAVQLYESTGWKRGPDLPPGYGPERTYRLNL